MAIGQQTETRFIELMSRLFQLDEAEALDFGIYRVIRQHNREVCAFLGTIVEENGSKRVQDGRLSAILEEAIRQVDDEAHARAAHELDALGRELGIKPVMTREAREATLRSLEGVRAVRDQIDRYRQRAAELDGADTAATDRAEVLNRLWQFFDRHYQDGDFIVERRYGRDGSRYIRSTGGDTEFHWATEDMHYIKSGDIFTDFPVTLSTGGRIAFVADPETLDATRAEMKLTDRAHYELLRVDRPEDGPVRVVLAYRKGAGSEAKRHAIVAAAHAAAGGRPEEIRRWLGRFTARNQSDFFIHKRLAAALAEDLDIFIKTEVLDTAQLLTEGDLSWRTLRVGRLVRRVGGEIIAFLGALEDFQKALWEKRKLVYETRYLITLDRIAALAGRAWLDARLPGIVDAQGAEWRSLGFGTIVGADACRTVIPGDLARPESVRYLPLPVDTKAMGDDFTWALLEAVTREHRLDEAIDGLAIHSDNWQALNTVQDKFRGRAKCIYLDPPYNTGGDGFPYKDAYRHASWAAMMDGRLSLAAPVMAESSALFCSIDHNERTALCEVLDRVFGAANRVEEIIWAQNTTKNQSPTYSNNHEYVEVYARSLAAAKAEKRMFREPKAGAGDVLDLVETLNADYPPIHAIEAEIDALYRRHQDKFRAQLEEDGLEYDKNLDPWRGLYNYSHAEYRDEGGRYVPEADARRVGAKIWVWQEADASMPLVSAGSQKAEVRDAKHANHRFYEPLHPDSKKACPAPKRGWVWPEHPLENFSGSFAEKDADHRIAWGEWNEKKPKVPRVKKFLHEVDTQVAKSVVLDYTDGEKELTNLTGTSRSFPNPKPTTLIARFIGQTTDAGDWVCDFGAGSGTTWHAALSAAHDDHQRRKVLLVEGGPHFHTTMLDRVKRTAAAKVWRNGRPSALNGPGLFLRVQSLEQYDDTLENIDLAGDDAAELPLEDAARRLRYRLDQAARRVYCAVDRFSGPFGYGLKRATLGGAAPVQAVDLVESLVYRLALDVALMLRRPEGVVVTGTDRRGRTVSVFFRDTTHPESAAWVERMLAGHPADRVLTNHPAQLIFDGCQRFEAIEALFAEPFGGW